jgi:predicted XRE-type DNA-binding protein
VAGEVDSLDGTDQVVVINAGGSPAIWRMIDGVMAMSRKRLANVWDAIERTPEDARNMNLRSGLMMPLQSHIARRIVGRTQSAKVVGVQQPRISDPMRGKINLSALNALVNMAFAAGMRVEMRLRKVA